MKEDIPNCHPNSSSTYPALLHHISSSKSCSLFALSRLTMDCYRCRTCKMMRSRRSIHQQNQHQSISLLIFFGSSNGGIISCPSTGISSTVMKLIIDRVTLNPMEIFLFNNFRIIIIIHYMWSLSSVSTP